MPELSFNFTIQAHLHVETNMLMFSTHAPYVSNFTLLQEQLRLFSDVDLAFFMNLNKLIKLDRKKKCQVKPVEKYHRLHEKMDIDGHFSELVANVEVP